MSKKMICYKQFRLGRDGRLYPLYIEATKEVPVGVTLEAIEPQMTKSGRVKSRLGELCYRPGWHCCEIPLADHIGTRADDGTLLQRKNAVWCEIELDYEIDYTEGLAKRYKSHKKRMLKHLPTDGFYWYQTNPNAKVKWLISHRIKVTRMLTNEEVDKLCYDFGVTPQKREE